MSKSINFGENVQGYNIPVLNEREIRASAGLLFFVLFASIMKVHFEGDFLVLKYFVTVFFTDMIIRVFVNPTFPTFADKAAPLHSLFDLSPAISNRKLKYLRFAFASHLKTNMKYEASIA